MARIFIREQGAIARKSRVYVFINEALSTVATPLSDKLTGTPFQDIKKRLCGEDIYSRVRRDRTEGLSLSIDK